MGKQGIDFYKKKDCLLIKVVNLLVTFQTNKTEIKTNQLK